MATLHANGWQQGSLLKAQLELSSVVLRDGVPSRDTAYHDEWMVASQDCELAQAEEDVPEPIIELRPVYRDNPPVDWGIRSQRLRLTDTPACYLVSTSPRVHIAPAALTALLAAEPACRDQIPDSRRPGVKLWLGKRYDRPAVPPALVPLAIRIAKEVRRRERVAGEVVRDVLMQFHEHSDPPRFSLYAVLDDASDEGAVRQWLAEIAQAVPRELGIGDVLEAAPASRISLQLIETSYAADVSQVTWGGQEPTGAH